MAVLSESGLAPDPDIGPIAGPGGAVAMAGRSTHR